MRSEPLRKIIDISHLQAGGIESAFDYYRRDERREDAAVRNDFQMVIEDGLVGCTRIQVECVHPPEWIDVVANYIPTSGTESKNHVRHKMVAAAIFEAIGADLKRGPEHFPQHRSSESLPRGWNWVYDGSIFEQRAPHGVADIKVGSDNTTLVAEVGYNSTSSLNEAQVGRKIDCYLSLPYSGSKLDDQRRTGEYSAYLFYAPDSQKEREERRQNALETRFGNVFDDSN